MTVFGESPWAEAPRFGPPPAPPPAHRWVRAGGRLHRRNRAALDAVKALRADRRARVVAGTFRPSRRAWVTQALRATAISLRRNGPLTAAGILCAAVALSLLGAALVVGRGVGSATIRWRGGVETIVFLEPTASPALTAEIGRQLRASPAVAHVRFTSQRQALAEFRVMFRNSPDMVQSATARDLPASWRVVPVRGASETDIAAIGRPFVGRRGVFQVVDGRDAVASVLKVSRVVRNGLLVLAGALGAAAWLLGWTTCRAAAWARRDEIAVMRLVGAPGLLVRAPFLLEGALQGLAGAAVATATVWVVTGVVQAKVIDGASLAILRNFSVPRSEVLGTCLLLLVVGTLGGAVGAVLAVHRYVAAGDGNVRPTWRRRLRSLAHPRADAR